MSFRNRVKKNVPKVALDSIMSLIVGSYKTGKTRLWKEVTELHYPGNPDAALLLAFEKGYETWELDNFIPVHEGYSIEENPRRTGEDWEVWDYFRKVVVKGLVDEAKNGRIVKLLGIDTADRAVDACTQWILHETGRKYGKTFTSAQEISDSTNDNGWTLIYEELKRQMDALTNAGYGVMTLAWTKEKETTLYNGKKYNSIELMMNNTAKKVFESQASLICCLHNEVTILDGKGNELEENLKDKKGKEKATNFHETKTVMYFRPSEYVSIAGGRYTNLPDKVDYSAENFLEVFENAVKGQLKNTDKTIEELEKEEQEQKDINAKRYVEEQEEVTANDPKELIAQITVLVDKMETPQKQQLAVKFKEIFKTTSDYKKVTDVEQLQQALELAKTL